MSEAIRLAKGDRVQFTQEAVDCGVVPSRAFGWIAATPTQRSSVQVKIDGKKTAQYYHPSFVEVIGWLKGRHP